MPAARNRRIVRRRVLVVALLVLAPLLYCSSFVSAAFLLGAGVSPRPAYSFLCDTAFAPLFSSCDVVPLGWLFDMAFESYMLGIKATH